MTRDPARRLHRRYLGALIVVAFLAILNQLLVQPPLLHLATDAPVINVAGRQRMLSQRLAKAALALEISRDPQEQALRRQELEQVLVLWTNAHDELRLGQLSGSRNSLEVRSAFDELQPDFDRIRDAAFRLLRVQFRGEDPSRPTREALATILASEGRYLERMDRIVGLYEHETSGRVAQLLWTGRVVTVLILALLVATGLLVLRPATRLIERQIQDLRAAQEDLEHRVQERTRELELAAGERSIAETRTRELVEQFSHVARTNTIGEMASGLAHELNQPLGAIANYTEGCLVALESPEPALGDLRLALEKVLGTTLRAGQIIQRIRRFVTRHGLERERFAPNPLVEEVEALFRDEAERRGIALQLDLAPGLPYLWGDPVQVQQVLVNLTRNAIDALSAAKPQQPTVVMQTRPADSGGVEFHVHDNGEGIPREQRDLIFDAFFSTRAEGMGMGLAISRTIVEAHGGRLAVESEPGAKTSFKFTLPPFGDDHAQTHGLHR
jgi:two-component system, LuxR family, sensor kinase FixL